MPGASRQFTAPMRDQFGEPYAGKVAWSVSGCGRIDSAGLFTSDGTEGDGVGLFAVAELAARNGGKA